MTDTRPADPAGLTHPLNQLLVSASAVGIVAVDNKGVIRSCNPAAAQLMARPADELIGHPLGFPTVVDEVRDIDLMLPDGSIRVVEMRVSTTSWDGQRLYITALHEPIREVADLQGVLQRQTMVLAAVAQELTDPLAAINRAVHQLRHDPDTSGKRRGELIDRIDERTQYLQALARRLRTATRMDPDRKLVVTEPTRVFEFLLERLHELHETSRSVRLFCDAGIVAFVDRADFTQMLDSYLHNALTHGGLPVDLRANREGDWVEIRVCDRGPGVPEEIRPHLFEQYLTDDGDEEGNGLELWITRGLARAHGGDAWYEPRRPNGACFCLRLPATPPTGR